MCHSSSTASESYDAHYAAGFEGLKTKWMSVDAASPLQAQARAAMERREQVIAAHLAKVRQQAAREAQLSGGAAGHRGGRGAGATRGRGGGCRADT